MSYINIETIKSEMGNLVKKYIANKKYYEVDFNFSEVDVRNEFINPMFQLFGWDVLNSNGSANYNREVIHEDTVEYELDGKIYKKKPDYSFNIGMERIFFLEAKKPSVDIVNDKSSAFQSRRYGWNANHKITILCNFNDLIIYDSSVRPIISDETNVARIRRYNYLDYIDKFDEIYSILSRDNVINGSIVELCGQESYEYVKEPFDYYFLKQIELWRKQIGNCIINNCKTVSKEELNYIVQRLVNRIVFLRICEDRALEKYEKLKNVTTYMELKDIFIEADSKYNSGIFGLIENELNGSIVIDDEVLVNIFVELYYPRSSYDFSVVEANVLGDIYEHFLAAELDITRGEVNLIQKNEISESNGVVTTPKYIVDFIVNSIIDNFVEEKGSDGLVDIKICDICCGSGVFLISSYECLINKLTEYYILKYDKFSEKIIVNFDGLHVLSFQEKRRILEKNIFGVDIDYQAVEVTKMSLLLKLLENENEKSLVNFSIQNKSSILPNIDDNIRCGNSIVDINYIDFKQNNVTDEELFRVKPFNWNQSFKAVFANGGFNVIVGNPPYIRIQKMVKYSPNEVEYFKSEYSGFKTAKSESFDKYNLFIERGLQLLENQGNLGYITPNKFLVIKSGRELRSIISKGNHVNEIVHFGTNQIFSKYDTYTCILILNRGGKDNFKVTPVSNLAEWRCGEDIEKSEYSSSYLSDKPWVFVEPRFKKIFDKMYEGSTLLSDCVDIFVGLQTSRDEIYIINEVSRDENFVYFDEVDGTRSKVERGIVKPAIYDLQFDLFENINPNSYIIFPYIIKEGKSELIDIQTMKDQYPNCFEYLLKWKNILDKRSVNGYTNETWYRYGRSQSLTKFNNQDKIVWPVLSKEQKYILDSSNLLFTGGGNGPYYALRPCIDREYDILFVLALLSFPAIEAIIKSHSSFFRGNYYSHGKQFLQGLPFPKLSGELLENNDYKRVISYMEQLLDISSRIKSESLKHRKNLLAQKRDLLYKNMNRMISILYNIGYDDLDIINEFLGQEAIND